MIGSTHLISSPSAEHVHSFQCLWLQKILRIMEDIVPEQRKNHPHESVSITQENLPNAYYLYITSISINNCRIAIILQFVVDFIQLLF